MINVKVSYTVKPGFADKNKENIARFLDDFKQMPAAGFSYNVYLQADGVTFIHFSSYDNEVIQQEVLNVPSFKVFQKERDESGLNNSHQVEVLQFIGSSAN